MTTPHTHLVDWIGFHLLLLLLLAAELLFARRRGSAPTARSVHRTSVVATIGWLLAALLFALFLFHTRGAHPASEFLAGYTIEQALSIDNLFVFLLLFRAFRIEPRNQPRVLFWGVAGAIVMRGLFISAGISLLEHVHWISDLFGAVLLIAAFRLLLPKNPATDNQPPRWLAWLNRLHPVSLRQDRFFAPPDDNPSGRPLITVLLLSLIAIELTDVVFALDSIPAVLSITRDPFLAYTSNILAVVGLRSLFFLLTHLLERLRYLHLGLAAVLAFAALKMLAAPWLAVGPLTSLLIILGLLLATVVASIINPAAPTHSPPKPE